MLTLLATSLIGCGLARAERMREALLAWHDHDIHDAIAKMGPPTQIYPNGPTSIYLWEREGPTIATFSTWMSGSRAASGSGMAGKPVCRYWFVVNGDGTIISSRLEGQCWSVGFE